MEKVARQMTLIQTTPNPFEFVSQHLQVIGWPALLYFAWKVSGYFARITMQATKTIGQIDSMATNHFPHMQESLAKQDTFLHSVDESLKTLVARSHRNF